MSAYDRSGPAGTTSLGGAITPDRPRSTVRPARRQAARPPDSACPRSYPSSLSVAAASTALLPSESVTMIGDLWSGTSDAISTSSQLRDTQCEPGTCPCENSLLVSTNSTSG